MTPDSRWVARASAAFLLASAFQRDHDFIQARHWYRQVLEQAPECELARHSLRTVSHWAMAAADGGGRGHDSKGGGAHEHVALAHGETIDAAGVEETWALNPSVRYVHDAFEGYAAMYDSSMRALGYRASEMLVAAVTAVLDAEFDDVSALGGNADVIKLWDLGCGTGLVGQELTASQQAGTWPQQWGAAHRTCVELSGRMLAVARAKGHYDEYVHGDIADVLLAQVSRAEGSAGRRLLLAADVAPYMGSLDPFLQGAAAALRPGDLLALTIEGLEAHLPLPARLERLFHNESSRSSADVAHDGVGGVDGGLHGDGGEPWGRGWELMPSGRIAHLRSHVEHLSLARGFEIAAVGDGPIRWQGGLPVEGHVFVLRIPAS